MRLGLGFAVLFLGSAVFLQGVASRGFIIFLHGVASRGFIIFLHGVASRGFIIFLHGVATFGCIAFFGGSTSRGTFSSRRTSGVGLIRAIRSRCVRRAGRQTRS